MLTAHITSLGPTPFSVIADGATVIAAGFTSNPHKLLLDRGFAPGEIEVDGKGSAVAEALDAYLDGDAYAIDSIRVRPVGSDVMQRMWKRLRKVAPGTTVSYADLAGERRMARVAGMACGRNPIPLFVPCHRVIRGDGTLGGFGPGLPVKRWLLAHERKAVGLNN